MADSEAFVPIRQWILSAIQNIEFCVIENEGSELKKQLSMMQDPILKQLDA